MWPLKSVHLRQRGGSGEDGTKGASEKGNDKFSRCFEDKKLEGKLIIEETRITRSRVATLSHLEELEQIGKKALRRGSRNNGSQLQRHVHSGAAVECFCQQIAAQLGTRCVVVCTIKSCRCSRCEELNKLR